MTDTLAPIALFVYNRLEHTARTIEHLQRAELAQESILFVFSDAAKSESAKFEVEKVRSLANNITGFLSVQVVERSENLGLKTNIILGVSDILKNHESVIVLEDDLLCSGQFLVYHNSCLSKFAENKRIQSISGYSPPIDKKSLNEEVFLLQRPSSWGWSTWRDRWEACKWDKETVHAALKTKGNREVMGAVGSDLYPMLQKNFLDKINSWAVMWALDHIIKDTYCVYPDKSLIKNIGTDGSGTNFIRTEAKYDVELSEDPIALPNDPKMFPEVAESYRRLYNISVVRRLINFFKLDVHMFNQ